MELERSNKLNANRTYIYTDECVTCGHTEGYKLIANRLKLLNKDVFVKQTPLFIGWQNEAAEIGLTMPFAYDCDTGNYNTCEELDKLSDEELEEWLGIRNEDRKV